MATPTYDLITSHTVSSTAGIAFDNISQDYRDLIIVVTGKGAFGGLGCQARVNNDSASNYFYVLVEANGTQIYSGNGSSTRFLFSSSGAFDTGANGIWILQFMDYSATDKHKTVLTRTNGDVTSGRGLDMGAHMWANTSAITKVDFYAGNFATGTTIYLYGVAS